MNAPKYLQTHTQFTQSDYEYFRSKGWSNQEIKSRWNTEKAQGVEPVAHKPAFDIVGYLNS